jgi:hypothetical protein
MPKQVLQIKDFSGGLNTLKNPADIAENELQVIENLSVKTQGSITPAYLNTDSTNNKISAYNNSHIDHIEAGYGLGYFETDRVRDPVVVTQTSSITGDDDNEGSATGFIARQVGGVYREIEYRSGGTLQTLSTSFPVGSTFMLTSSTFSADGLDPQSQGIYTVVAQGESNVRNIIVDKTIAINIESAPQDFWGATLTGITTGDKVILLAHPDEHKIDTYSTNTAGTNWHSDTITLRSSASGINSKVKYYKVEDEIRCCDTANKNSSKIQWYGWIQRRHFEGCDRSTDDNTYLAYYAKDNTLAKPTAGHVSSSEASAGALAKYKSTAATTYSAIAAGTGFNVYITTETDQEGAIPAGTYEVAQTFIYDNNQESLPAAYTTTHTVSDTNDLKCLSISVGTRGPFDPRISGGRIYIREQNADAEWTMLVDIDLTKGGRLKFTDDYSAWENAFFAPTATTGNSSTALTSVSDVTYLTDGMTISGGNIQAGTTIASHNGSNVITLSQATAGSGGASGVTLSISGSFYSCPDYNQSDNNFRLKEFGLLTYEIINGFSSKVFSHTISDEGEHWKDSVIANNRAFVCNVTIKDENTGVDKDSATTTHFRDRIMYSMPNRYDTFPYHNYIEAAKGDADSYTAIESYGDRLFAYKQTSVDIINIASPDDATWFLEETKKYMGVSWHEAVKLTQYGILWVNKDGLFLYDGSQIRNFKENKIDDATWVAFVTTQTGILYDEKTSLAYITKDYNSNNDGYTLNLKRGTFTQTTNFINIYASNSVDTDDNVLIAQDSGSSVDLYQLYRTEVANTCDFRTKDFDFGDPSTTKKIYAVYVTYKSDGVLTNYFTLEEDDGTSHALAGTIAASATNYATVKITPSSPVVCNKVSVKFDSSSNARKLYINDIGIEYRMLKKRAG